MEQIILEYSQSQKAFHKESMKEMIINNRNNILLNIETGYQPIGIFNSHDECDNFITHFRECLSAMKID